jgi:hypothetical protein
MRVLLIDKEKIAVVIKNAEKNKFSKPLMYERLNGGGICPGDNKSFYCELIDGFKCVFSIEEQSFGWCRHLSVSVNSPDKLPSIPAVELLMQEFGFKEKSLKDCRVWIEQTSPKAINILGVK